MGFTIPSRDRTTRRFVWPLVRSFLPHFESEFCDEHTIAIFPNDASKKARTASAIVPGRARHVAASMSGGIGQAKATGMPVEAIVCCVHRKPMLGAAA